MKTLFIGMALALSLSAFAMEHEEEKMQEGQTQESVAPHGTVSPSSDAEMQEGMRDQTDMQKMEEQKMEEQRDTTVAPSDSAVPEASEETEIQQ